MLVKSRNNVILPSLVDGLFGNEFLEGLANTEKQTSQVAVNIAENEKSFRVELVFPGVEKERFEIDVTGDILKVSVNEEEEKEEKSDWIYSKREFNYVSFSKQFDLPETADIEKISAEYKSGILYITIPKKEEVKIEPRKISID